MLDPSEYELDKTEPTYDVGGDRWQRRSWAPWLIAGVVILAGAAAIWFFVMDREAEQPAAEQAARGDAVPPSPAAAPRPVCEATNSTPLPPLDDSDTVVGKLARTLSANPRVTAWLATDNLVRNFTVVVDNIASGTSPAARLRALRPSGAFRVTETEEGLFVDPRTYERYAPIAAAVDSVDTRAAAQLCGTLKPRFDEAYGELGRGGSFDAALERAIVAMLSTPAPGADAPLVQRGAMYRFEDPALEGLTPAQKHLARMGPRNMRVIQDKLRQVALAIGIPSERLPQ